MRKTVLTGAVVVLVLCVVTGAIAMEFSADMVSSAHGQTTASKVFAKDQKFRMRARRVSPRTLS